MKPKNPFNWRGIHHGYLGLFFMAFGAFFWYMDINNGLYVSLIPLFQGFLGVGTYIFIDDVIEHTITASTPLRLLWEKLWKK